ncbi:Fc.00g094490.m01.CDS01 [Cosmosporella sp. VM-42]
MSPANSLDGAIVSIINRKSGTAVDLKLAGGSKNDTPIFGYRFHGGKNQQWKLKMVDNGSPWPVWMLKNVKFGTYMDLFGSGTANGTKVVGWSGGTTTNQNQLWRLITADPNCQLFMLQNVGSNTYLDLAGGKSDPRFVILALSSLE